MRARFFYTCDALDRPYTVTHGSSTIRFRYVGLTTQVAQFVDHQADADPYDHPVIRSLANDWAGMRLFVWTGSSSNQEVGRLGVVELSSGNRHRAKVEGFSLIVEARRQWDDLGTSRVMVRPRKLRRSHSMAKVSPWYSIRTRDVHHNSTLCKTGNNIESENRRDGTGGLPRCQECARVDP